MCAVRRQATPEHKAHRSPARGGVPRTDEAAPGPADCSTQGRAALREAKAKVEVGTAFIHPSGREPVIAGTTMSANRGLVAMKVSRYSSRHVADAAIMPADTWSTTARRRSRLAERGALLASDLLPLQ